MENETRSLLEEIEALFEGTGDLSPEQARQTFERFLVALEEGRVRAAHQVALDGGLAGSMGWVVEPAVKKGILLGFRLGQNIEMNPSDFLRFSDKDTYPTQSLDAVGRNIRIVPGGNSVRRGAYLGKNVTMMPPAFVNVGAYVGDGTMVDSHALVGSCAQIGRGVHLSAGAQVGGVLEPIGQTPVIIEDDALIGGNTGLYEGVQVGKGAVIGAGCVITASTPVFDVVRETVYRATKDAPLRIPEGAVVIPGSRPARGDFARQHGLQMAALLIIKYRDDKTDASTALEEFLR